MAFTPRSSWRAIPSARLSAADLAERFGVSSHHLAKVLRTLVNAGLVQGGRGAAGGYRFTGNRRRTTLMDIVALFEPAPGRPRQEPGEDTDIGGALQRVLLGESTRSPKRRLRSISLETMLKPSTMRLKLVVLCAMIAVQRLRRSADAGEEPTPACRRCGPVRTTSAKAARNWPQEAQRFKSNEQMVSRQRDRLRLALDGGKTVELVRLSLWRQRLSVSLRALRPSRPLLCDPHGLRTRTSPTRW